MKMLSKEEFESLPAGCVFALYDEAGIRSRTFIKGEDEPAAEMIGDKIVLLQQEDLESEMQRLYDKLGFYRNHAALARRRPLSDETAHPIHVDEWLDRTPIYRGEEEPLKYVHFMLSYFRMPAIIQTAHRPFMKHFMLFVDFEGKTWRVTGASRMGDIFLAEDLTRETGYDRREMLDFQKMTGWRDSRWPAATAEQQKAFDDLFARVRLMDQPQYQMQANAQARRIEDEAGDEGPFIILRIPVEGDHRAALSTTHVEKMTAWLNENDWPKVLAEEETASPALAADTGWIVRSSNGDVGIDSTTGEVKVFSSDCTPEQVEHLTGATVDLAEYAEWASSHGVENAFLAHGEADILDVAIIGADGTRYEASTNSRNNSL